MRVEVEQVATEEIDATAFGGTLHERRHHRENVLDVAVLPGNALAVGGELPNFAAVVGKGDGLELGAAVGLIRRIDLGNQLSRGVFVIIKLNNDDVRLRCRGEEALRINVPVDHEHRRCWCSSVWWGPIEQHARSTEGVVVVVVVVVATVVVAVGVKRVVVLGGGHLVLGLLGIAASHLVVVGS